MKHPHGSHSHTYISSSHPRVIIIPGHENSTSEFPAKVRVDRHGLGEHRSCPEKAESHSTKLMSITSPRSDQDPGRPSRGQSLANRVTQLPHYHIWNQRPILFPLLHDGKTEKSYSRAEGNRALHTTSDSSTLHAICHAC